MRISRLETFEKTSITSVSHNLLFPLPIWDYEFLNICAKVKIGNPLMRIRISKN
jgi:hypothetical protein